MTSRDFAYWLQGFFEIQNPETISKEQILMIKKHLNMVFVHEIDPTFGDDKKQEQLNKIHSWPTTEQEAVIKWGPKPSPKHEFNMHGWYNPKEGIPKC